MFSCVLFSLLLTIGSRPFEEHLRMAKRQAVAFHTIIWFGDRHVMGYVRSYSPHAFLLDGYGRFSSAATPPVEHLSTGICKRRFTANGVLTKINVLGVGSGLIFR